MALYFYQALSKEGKRVQGTLDAPSINLVRQQLTAQDMYPVSISLASERAGQNWLARLFAGGVPVQQKILFTKQLSILIRSGVPLMQALELLIDQFTGQMRTILVSVKDEVKEGIALADALKKYPKTFENIYVQLIRAGEASGKLEVILDRLTDYLERQEEMRKRVSDALSYPMMQLGMAVLIVGGLLAFVVPQMKDNFTASGKQLPSATQFLITLSDLIMGHYIILLVGFIGFVVGWKYWSSTAKGARTIDEVKLRLPLIKYFAKTNAVVQFSQTLGMLIEGGVNLSEALDIVCAIIDNRVLADAIAQARDKIIKQGKIAQYLKQTNIFPPIAIYLISTGEETGKLDTMLLEVAKTYETELAELADGLSDKIGPVLLVVMALIVGFIVVAIALPIVQMSDIGGA